MLCRNTFIAGSNFCSEKKGARQGGRGRILPFVDKKMGFVCENKKTVLETAPVLVSIFLLKKEGAPSPGTVVNRGFEGTKKGASQIAEGDGSFLSKLFFCLSGFARRFILFFALAHPRGGRDGARVRIAGRPVGSERARS
jgi:hypothetical protein